MALTKYQCLEKAIRQMFDRLNEFYAQITQTLSTGQAQKMDDSWTIDNLFDRNDISLSQDTLVLIQRVRSIAILFCPNDDELYKGIPWFQKDEKINSLAYQIQRVSEYEEKRHIERERLCKNLEQLSEQYFLPIATNRQGKFHHPYNKLQTEEWFPTRTMTVLQAYLEIKKSLALRLNRSYDPVKIAWKDYLEELIFKGFNWDDKQKQEVLEDLLEQGKAQGSKSGGRWKSSYAIDFVLYASFLEYFVNQFLEDPTCCQVEGEIVCFLWIAVHLSQDYTLKLSIESLLELTTNNIEGGIILINNEKIDLSEGLESVLKAYLGEQSTQRCQKIFPHLNPATLKRRFRDASELISPKNPVLPEAFLTFPHGLDGARMRSSMRKNQLETLFRF